jgi:hypothetical protein
MSGKHISHNDDYATYGYKSPAISGLYAIPWWRLVLSGSLQSSGLPAIHSQTRDHQHESRSLL